MKSKFLEKYRKNELEITESRLETFAPEKPNALHFFPEFENKIPTPFGNSLDPKITVPSLLPFYENLIVGISPFKDSCSFERNYGLNINEIIDLVDKKRLSIVLNGYPEDYKGLDYLAPIFNEIKPPSIIRFRKGFDIALSDGKFEKYRKQGVKLFHGKISNSISKESYLSKTIKSVDKIERGAIAGYLELKIIGAENAIEQIESLAKSSPFRAATLINSVFRPFYTDSIYGSLGGQHALLKSDNLEKYIDKSTSEKIWFFPEEIGKSLIDKLDINYPTNYDVFKDVDIEYTDFRKALAALENEVKKLTSKKLISEKEAIEKTWEKVNEVTKREKYFKKAIQSIGVLGPASVSLIEAASLIQIIFPAIAGMYGILIEDKIARKASRFLNSSNIIQVFELKEKINKTK